MNERIKQLAEQAGLKTELWNDPQPFVIYKEDANNPGGLEKFAELIVEEAAKAHLCDSDGVVGKYSDSDRYYFETLMKKQLGLE